MSVESSGDGAWLLTSDCDCRPQSQRHPCREQGGYPVEPLPACSRARRAGPDGPLRKPAATTVTASARPAGATGRLVRHLLDEAAQAPPPAVSTAIWRSGPASRSYESWAGEACADLGHRLSLRGMKA